MEWVTLGLAIIGTVTGIASLVWQVRMRTRGAHRVIVTASGSQMLYDLALGTKQGPFVQVDASNTGLTAVNVKSWSIAFADGMSAMQMTPSIPGLDVPLPHRLEPGSSVSFYILRSALQAQTGNRDLRTARAQVMLATGQKIASRRGAIKA